MCMVDAAIPIGAGNQDSHWTFWPSGRTITLEPQQSMATQPERIAALEQDKKFHWIALTAGAFLFLGWCGWLSLTLLPMKQEINAIRQDLKDHGAEVVRSLEAPKSAEQLRASLDLITAQAQFATAQGKRPDPATLVPIQKALLTESTQHPDLPQTWRAVASVASYRTVGIQLDAKSLPDCDMNVRERKISKDEVPEAATLLDEQDFGNGYVFRNCKVYMDRLPKGRGSLFRGTPSNITDLRDSARHGGVVWK